MAEVEVEVAAENCQDQRVAEIDLSERAAAAVVQQQQEHRRLCRGPQLAFYSRSGAIPYLNWNFVRQNRAAIIHPSSNGDENESPENRKEILLVHVSDLMILDKNGVLPTYSSMKYFDSDQFSSMVIQFDPFEKYQNFKSTDTSIPVLSIHGKDMVNVDQMIRCAQESGASMFQSLGDINSPQIAKKKWTQKVTARTVKFLEQTLAHLKTQESVSESKRIRLESPKVWATLTGGFSERERIQGCEAITANADHLSGVIIESFYGYHSEPRQFRSSQDSSSEDTKEAETKIVPNYFVDSYLDARELLRSVIIPRLPHSLPRALFGCFYPDDMLRFIAAGIDILDSSICTLLTKNGLALPTPLVDLERIKLNFRRPSSQPSSLEAETSTPGELIDVNEKRYVRLNSPISRECLCYTCKSEYSLAYLNHLYKRNELNGPMLVQIHNHYTLTQFFALIKQLITDGKFQLLLDNSGISY